MIKIVSYLRRLIRSGYESNVLLSLHGCSYPTMMTLKEYDIFSFGEALKNFSDTAALISNLDLVISVTLARDRRP